LGIGLPGEPERSDHGAERAIEGGNNCFREREPSWPLLNIMQAAIEEVAA
jgi:hypothetical protein